MKDDKRLTVSPEMIKAIAAVPLPNFHDTWKKYQSSQFRRDWMAAWAGDDPDRKRAAADLLRETTPM